MRTLGVNGAGASLYLAVAQDGVILDVAPYIFAEPSGLAACDRLPALRDRAEKTVKSLGVERVRILDPEVTYKAAAVSLLDRIALETVFALGAADAGVDCERLPRPTLRSLLALPKKGALIDLVTGVTPRTGPHWSPGKRDLAALAAIAAEEQPQR